VLEVEPDRRRIRLSHRAVQKAEEQRDAREYSDRQDQTRSESFGSMADKLRADQYELFADDPWLSKHLAAAASPESMSAGS